MVNIVQHIVHEEIQRLRKGVCDPAPLQQSRSLNYNLLVCLALDFAFRHRRHQPWFHQHFSNDDPPLLCHLALVSASSLHSRRLRPSVFQSFTVFGVILLSSLVTSSEDKTLTLPPLLVCLPRTQKRHSLLFYQFFALIQEVDDGPNDLFPADGDINCEFEPVPVPYDTILGTRL